jgi:opacity protein-like surface antigen
VPEEKVRTFDNPEGDGRYWDASSLALGLTYSRNLTDNFSIGFNVKYIRDQVWDMSASSIALDAGTMYTTPFNGLRIGASISNFGTKMKLEGRNTYFNVDPNNNPNSGPNNIPAEYRLAYYDIPLSFRVGLAMEVIKSELLTLTTAVDAVHPNDNTEFMNLGMELNFNNVFFARGGYKSLFLRDSEQSYTFGFGLNYPIINDINLSLNYGFVNYGRLKNVQFIDLVVKF